MSVDSGSGRDAEVVAPPSRDVGVSASRVAAFLEGGDAVSDLLPRAGPVRVEIRDRLVETDEREAENLRGEAFSDWVKALLRKVNADAGESRFRGGLSVGGPLRCFASCCDRPSGEGLKPHTLTLRRICFAYDEPDGHKLSLVSFVEYAPGAPKPSTKP